MRLHVIVRTSVNRPEHGHLVRMLGDQGKNFRNVEPALPILAKTEWAGHQRSRVPLTNDNFAFAREWLPRVVPQRGLRVKGIDMTHAAGHKQGNDARGARREVRLLGEERSWPGRLGF